MGLGHDRLDELVELMLDTVCSRRETIRIAGDGYPAEVVKSRFLELNSSHIEYALDRMQDNTTYVRNIKNFFILHLARLKSRESSRYPGLQPLQVFSNSRQVFAVGAAAADFLCALHWEGLPSEP